MKSETQIIGYVGANPGGRPPPDLSTVPVSTDNNFSFIFALAFAQDINRDGVFTPQWDASITPSLIQQLQAENPNRRFIASLAGGAFPWQAPPDETAWINNATQSLSNLKNLYSLDGFDLNYEGGTDDPSFYRVVDKLVQAMNDFPNFPPRFQNSFSITPFNATYQVYQELFTDNTTYIPRVNYQAYADGLDGVQGYLDKYAQLAAANPNREFGGYREIALGIASATAVDLQRGIQPPDIFTVWDSLHSQGAISVFVWCLEDSALTGFSIEGEIQARS